MKMGFYKTVLFRNEKPVYTEFGFTNLKAGESCNQINTIIENARGAGSFEPTQKLVCVGAVRANVMKSVPRRNFRQRVKKCERRQ